MDYSIKFQSPCLFKAKKFLFVVGIVALTHLLCQSLILPYGNALLSLLPDQERPMHGTYWIGARQALPDHKSPVHEEEVMHDIGSNSKLKDNINGFESDIRELNGAHTLLEKKNSYHGSASEEVVGREKDMEQQIVKGLEKKYNLAKVNESGNGFFLDYIVKSNFSMSREDSSAANKGLSSSALGKSRTPVASPSIVSVMESSLANATFMRSIKSNTNLSTSSTFSKKYFVGKQAKVLRLQEVQIDKSSYNNSSVLNSALKKKMRCDMPPKSVVSIYEMNHRLVQHRISSRSMRPRWSSIRDREILAAKLQIENAPSVTNDGDLYPPLFRNLSMLRRSYELMERMLKVYIYKDGEKPIFHQPILKGLYASEGWFMKLMERNKQFIVKDPRKAHLFYMPFSSRMLEYSLYVRNSHNRTNLHDYLKHYSEKIAAKYPFWNRTGGADHFLVACHDWAPYETRHHMEHCIKALCNADVTLGFKIGRDVSLPETYVRSARNPLRDLGGKPPSERNILAFFAGNMHGYLRPILLNYWKNKDPDMQIFGPMPPGVASKMNYIRHMKSSKYCICPKGYEVNSPRIVEAIFYECVPVIISDNFVPPFFEVLDWGSFSVLLAEKDIPHLRDILLSITNEKYLEMQHGVKKVQQHFLWHAKPMKYDLFHMTLHSIWYNRVFQTKPR